jgi:hypothetical protein
MTAFYRSKKHAQYQASALAYAVIFICLFLLSGCGRTAGPAAATASPAVEMTVQEQQPEPTIPVYHVVDPNPAPLDEADMAVSPVGYGAAGALTDDDLSLMDMLTYAVQDEYLAHGEYQAITDKFGDQPPYSNIAKAEEMHLGFLQAVYSAYGLDFPEDGSAEHVVVPDTLLEAAQTGVQAEINNIAMYELFLTYDLPEDVSTVFTALRDGSKSHLQAFQKQVDRLS